MLKRVLPILVILVFGFNPSESEAQIPWPMADSEWNYNYYLFWPPPGHYRKFYVNGIDSINGLACSRILMDHVQYNMFYTEGVDPIRHIRFDGDTLWHYVVTDSSFYPLICFNALPGDSWHPLPYDSLSVDTTCTVTPIMVEDTFSVNYSGQTFRGITIETTDGQSHLRWSGSFDERTFKNPNVSEVGWLFPDYNFLCDGGVVEWYFNHLLCYNDSELDLVLDGIASFNGEADCEFPWNTVGLDSPTDSNPAKVYPNPSDGLVRIELGQNMRKVTLRTYNSTGRLIDSQFQNSVPIFDYELPEQPGIYLIKLIDEVGQTTNFRVVKD